MEDADADPINELQQLRRNGDTISIISGNSIILKELSKVQKISNELSRLFTVQERLDAGSTPMQLLEYGISLDSLYGKSFQGGLIVYLDDLDTISGIKGLVKCSDRSKFRRTMGMLSEGSTQCAKCNSLATLRPRSRNRRWG